eukprot:409962-Pyramimonas_sp.AAC.1
MAEIAEEEKGERAREEGRKGGGQRGWARLELRISDMKVARFSILANKADLNTAGAVSGQT